MLFHLQRSYAMVNQKHKLKHVRTDTRQDETRQYKSKRNEGREEKKPSTNERLAGDNMWKNNNQNARTERKK